MLDELMVINLMSLAAILDFLIITRKLNNEESLYKQMEATAGIGFL